jgi:hypothetical protein
VTSEGSCAKAFLGDVEAFKESYIKRPFLGEITDKELNIIVRSELTEDFLKTYQKKQ